MKATKMLSGLVCWPMLGDGGEGGPNGVQWAAGACARNLSRANKKRHTIFTVTKNYNPCGGVLGEPASPPRHSLDLL